jgi:asparagine synthase (glutamine-hydrolysing)
MCGFLGQVNFGGSIENSHEELFKLAQLSIKRGPDNTGHSKGDGFLFIFNRLSILDLSDSGNQPKVSEDGRYYMVFNGEIYNHQELRKKLPAHTKFSSNGDSETLIRLFETWGIEKTIKELDGMFAIALFDTIEQKCHLIRDFAGIKPLFYGYKSGQVVFASQYDQVTKHSLFRNSEVDKEVLRLYLEQHYMPAPFGLLKNTAQVLPGGWVTFSKNGKERDEQYWTFPEFVSPTINTHAEAIDFLDKLLAEGVEAEMLADVPLGSFLSGGIDSPLITYYAQKKTGKPMSAFSIGSDSKVHDESEYATQYARQMGVEHYLKKMTANEALALWDEAMESIHEPFADFSILPTYAVSKLAKSKVKVALSGDGGDELFYGYERFGSVTKNYSLMRLPHRVKYLMYGTDKALFKNKHINSVILADSFGAAHQGLHSRMRGQWLDKLFPDLINTSLPDQYKTYKYNPANRDELLQSVRKAEFYGMMQKTLRKVDMASMHASLEVRVPFLKKSVIEGSLKFNAELSFGIVQGKEYRKKQLLKDLLVTKLPASPIDNVKRGFTIPLSAWIRSGLSEKLRSLNNNSTLSSLGMSSVNYDKLLDEHLKGTGEHKWPLFTIFGLQAWT